MGAVMRTFGVGRLVGLGLDVHRSYELDYTEMPSSWEVLLNASNPGFKAIRRPTNASNPGFKAIVGRQTLRFDGLFHGLLLRQGSGIRFIDYATCDRNPCQEGQ